jgi:hypothetical protein
MLDKGSVIAGLVGGGFILAFGLALILTKGWVWSLFGAFYGLLGIQAERTRMWEMFITTIGLGVAALGLFLMWAGWMRRRNDG